MHFNRYSTGVLTANASPVCKNLRLLCVAILVHKPFSATKANTITRLDTSEHCSPDARQPIGAMIHLLVHAAEDTAPGPAVVEPALQFWQLLPTPPVE